LDFLNSDTKYKFGSKEVVTECDYHRLHNYTIKMYMIYLVKGCLIMKMNLLF